MNERNSKILDAAKALFSRYGPVKTTMNDIAREAGVARQTLYNAYPNKDEVLRAVLRQSVEEMHGQVLADWGRANGLAEKLDIYFEAGPLTWYDLAQSSPEMAELFDGLHKIAKLEMDQAAALWVQAFQEMLADEGVPEGQRLGLADYICSTSGNAKYNAKSRETVVTRLALLKSSVLALIAQA